MKIYAYPGDRLDFVSASGGAGSVLYGDTRAQCEEFFGTPHQETPHAISYFLGAIHIEFLDGIVAEFRITPGASREKVDVYLGKDQLTGLPRQEIAQLIDGESVRVDFGHGESASAEVIYFR